MDGELIYIPGFLLALALLLLLIRGIRSYWVRRFILRGIYHNLAQCERALDYFSRRLAHYPHDWETYVRRARAFTFLKNHQQALRDYTQALALHPNDATILVLRGHVNYSMGKYDEAIWDGTRALDINPGSSAAYEMRGLAYFASDEYRLAERDYTRAIEMNPHGAQNYSNRGHYYLRTMELDLALADWEQSWRIQPDVATGLMLNWLKLTLVDQREDAAIAQSLEQVAALDPGSGEAYLCRGIALYLYSDYERALTLFVRAAKALSENVSIYFWQGMTLATLERNMQADQAFLRASDLGLPKALWQPMTRLDQQTQTTYWNYQYY